MTRIRPPRLPRAHGLAPDEIAQIDDILSQVGTVASVSALAETLGIEFKRLNNYYQSTEGKLARSKATDESRRLFYKELSNKSKDLPGERTLSHQEALDSGLSIRQEVDSSLGFSHSSEDDDDEPLTELKKELILSTLKLIGMPKTSTQIRKLASYVSVDMGKLVRYLADEVAQKAALESTESSRSTYHFLIN